MSPEAACPISWPLAPSTNIPVFTPLSVSYFSPCLFLGRISRSLGWSAASYIVKDDFEPLNLFPPPLKFQRWRHATKMPSLWGTRNMSQGFVSAGWGLCWVSYVSSPPLFSVILSFYVNINSMRANILPVHRIPMPVHQCARSGFILWSRWPFLSNAYHCEH